MLGSLWFDLISPNPLWFCLIFLDFLRFALISLIFLCSEVLMLGFYCACPATRHRCFPLWRLMIISPAAQKDLPLYRQWPEKLRNSYQLHRCNTHRAQETRISLFMRFFADFSRDISEFVLCCPMEMSWVESANWWQFTIKTKTAQLGLKISLDISLKEFYYSIWNCKKAK